MANHYETLGVARGASDEEIKKAFRKLTRQYHPDVSQDKDAPAKMAGINAAYDVLRDADKRKEYDFELDNPQPDFSQSAGRGASGGRGRAGGFSAEDFAQAFGQRGYGQFNDMGGTGFGGGGFSSGGFDSSQFNFEDLFGGSFGQAGGRQRRSGPQRGEDQHAILTIDLQAAYDGASRQISLQVPQLVDGQVSMQRKTLNVKIPKGVKAGQTIRLAGQGLPGLEGGAAGDLLLEIQFDADSRYQIDGRDVTMTVAISPWEAALGGSITVDTPAGRVEVKVPADSQSGRKLRLSGRGIPGEPAGNLYLSLNVVLPPATDPAARKLYEQMRDQLAFNPRLSS